MKVKGRTRLPGWRGSARRCHLGALRLLRQSGTCRGWWPAAYHGTQNAANLGRGVKADVVLAVPRVPTAVEDLRFHTAHDVESLDEFDIDGGDVGGTGDGR